MWTLHKPTTTARQAYLACISKVKDAALKARLQSIEEEIVQASSEFEAAAAAVTLHTLEPQEDVGGIVTVEEMSDVYNYRMVKQTSPGRAIYDALLAAPAHGRCPLCGQRIVSTLDHHLPKARYPALAVAPINLVPACADCNKAKLHSLPANSQQETLHPYFDNIQNDPWLRAEVVETSPAAVRFYVSPPENWGATLAARVLHHFNLLKLPQLYTSHAAGELLNIRHYLGALFFQTGHDGVQTHLLNHADSCEQAHVNSWQTAAYRALSGSAWYCSGGFA